MKEEVVNETPAEPTVDVVPTTTEATEAPSEGQETAEIAEKAPVSETTSTAKVSETVPYDRFKEVNDKLKETEELLAASQPVQTQDDAVDFDDPTRAGIRREAANIVAEQKMADFLGTHRDELVKDPLLDAAFRRELAVQSSQGTISPESAYKNAQQVLEQRLNAKAETAKAEGLEEGKEVAKTKQQLGAVGETGKQPELDVEKLSAEEYRKALNIPRDDSPPSL